MVTKSIKTKAKVLPEWVDYNGHMRDAYYSLLFSFGVDDLMDAVGIDHQYRSRTKGTIYVIEWHNYFLREVKEQDSLVVDTMVLDSDAKRMHLYQCMRSKEHVVAICESMQLHVSQQGQPKAAEMPDEIQQLVLSLRLSPEETRKLPYRSGTIEIRRR